jgi:hypothetical protein
MAPQCPGPVATTLTLGTELVATVTEEAGSGRWRTTADALPEGWDAIVRTRGGLAPPSGPTTYWIFSVDENKRLVLLSNSDFGRLPISDRMRPRYASALADILRMLSEEGEEPGIPLAPSISEVKGMINKMRAQGPARLALSLQGAWEASLGVDATDGRGLGSAPPSSA